MAIKYYKLLDMLQRKEISKGQFAQMTGLSGATVAKLSGHRPVNVEVIDRVCKALDCQPGDIMEYVPDAEELQQNMDEIIINNKEAFEALAKS